VADRHHVDAYLAGLAADQVDLDLYNEREHEAQMESLDEGRRLRDEGKEMAGGAPEAAKALAQARTLARSFCELTESPVSANHIHQWLPGMSKRFPNAMGSIFKGKDWEPVGWTQATHKEAHARSIRTYRYKGGSNGSFSQDT